MRFTSSSRQSTGRRLVLALAVVVALAGLGASAWAQEAQQQAAPQQQQTAPGLTFGTDAGIIFNMIKPDKTADFEGVMAKVKEALANRDRAFFQVSALKQVAAGAWAVDLNIGPQKKAGLRAVGRLAVGTGCGGTIQGCPAPPTLRLGMERGRFAFHVQPPARIAPRGCAVLCHAART